METKSLALEALASRPGITSDPESVEIELEAGAEIILEGDVVTLDEVEWFSATVEDFTGWIPAEAVDTDSPVSEEPSEFTSEESTEQPETSVEELTPEPTESAQPQSPLRMQHMAPQTLSVPAAAPTLDPTKLRTIGKGLGYVTVCSAAFKENPWATATTLATLAKGTQVKTTNQSIGAFWKVTHAGRTGWIKPTQLTSAAKTTTKVMTANLPYITVRSTALRLAASDKQRLSRAMPAGTGMRTVGLSYRPDGKSPLAAPPAGSNPRTSNAYPTTPSTCTELCLKASLPTK